jgi:hypothetical protein
MRVPSPAASTIGSHVLRAEPRPSDIADVFSAPTPVCSLPDVAACLDSANLFKLIRPQGTTMAKALGSAANGVDDDGFRWASLLRMACWGIGAAAAMFLAVLAGLSDRGASRLDGAIAALTGRADATVAAATTATVYPVQTEVSPVADAQRLSDRIEQLTADRDRLLERLSTLEHNLQDVTGSIRRHEPRSPGLGQEAKSTPVPPIGPLWSSAPQLSMSWATSAPAAAPAATLAPVRTAKGAAHAPPSPPQANASGGEVEITKTKQPLQPTAVVKPETTQPRQPLSLASASEAAEPHAQYGIDLGGAASLTRLHLLWSTLQGGHAALFDGLYPAARASEPRHGVRPDMRLLVGPLATAEDARKLCAALAETVRACAPAIFRGERLLP